MLTYLFTLFYILFSFLMSVSPGLYWHQSAFSNVEVKIASWRCCEKVVLFVESVVQSSKVQLKLLPGPTLWDPSYRAEHALIPGGASLPLRKTREGVTLTISILSPLCLFLWRPSSHAGFVFLSSCVCLLFALAEEWSRSSSCLRLFEIGSHSVVQSGL